MTKAEAYRVVAMIQGAWPRPPLPDGTGEVYAMSLADLDFERTKAAVTRLVQTSRFLPTVAEIREAAAKDRVSLPAPEEAWGVVRRAIGKHGSYRVPVFDCDEIQAATDAIGWKEICLAEGDAAQAANRSRWIDAYKAFRSRRLEDEARGVYRPADRQLPPRSEVEREPGDSRVLVETGYATQRLALVPAETEADASARQLTDGLAELLTRRPK